MKEQSEYQFLYWNDIERANDKITVIKAASVKAACGKFIRNRLGNQSQLVVDYEVQELSTGKYIDIRQIKSIKDYIS